MKIVVDTHTHSVASGHAYSTVQENSKAACRHGLKAWVLTDHGPKLLGGPCLYHFGNLRIIPPIMDGVRFLKGVEANILNLEGELDMPADYLARLDFVLAGFHENCFAPGTLEAHMKAIEAAMRNPLVDAISHPGNPVYPIDIEGFVRLAGECGKPVEINNSSFNVRPGSAERCAAIARSCVRQGVRVVCGSDAHISFDVGRFDKVLKVFREIGMPKTLVINASIRSFDAYLEERRARVAASLSRNGR